MIFDIIDKTGRKIHLSKERWNHILEHKGMENYLEDIKDTLKNPIKIISHDTGELYDYYTFHKHKKYNSKFLMVVVKYLNGAGFVLTAYFVPQITI